MSALINALMPTHAALEQLATDANAVQELQTRILHFQQRHFPDQPLSGKLKHCQKEIDEILADPSDIIEWADAFILLLGAAAKQFFTVSDLVEAAHAKLDVCETRKWGPADEEGVHHHIEEGAPSTGSAVVCENCGGPVDPKKIFCDKCLPAKE